MTGGFISHGIAYLEMPPEYPGYICTDTATGLEVLCAPHSEEADPYPAYCGSTQYIDNKVDFSEHPANLYNLYTYYELGCRPKSATALIGMVVFFGSAVACLFVPRLGDLWGRKPIFCFSLAFQAPLIYMVVFVTTLKYIYIACFFFGMCIIGRMSCGFLLMMELVPNAY